jgi:hypothetical protein
MYQETTWGNVRRWLGVTFGVRSREKLASWALAGGLAYYLFYLPEVRKAEQIKVRCVQRQSGTMHRGHSHALAMMPWGARATEDGTPPGACRAR